MQSISHRWNANEFYEILHNKWNSVKRCVNWGCKYCNYNDDSVDRLLYNFHLFLSSEIDCSDNNKRHTETCSTDIRRYVIFYDIQLENLNPKSLSFVFSVLDHFNSAQNSFFSSFSIFFFFYLLLLLVSFVKIKHSI